MADTEGIREEPGTEDPEAARGRQDDLKLTRHSYRAVLGDRATFAPALKGELTRRGVRDVGEITTVNDGADWIWDLVQSYLPKWRVEVLDWPHALPSLAKAAKAGLGEGTEKANRWLEQRETELWRGQVIQVEIALYNLPRRYKERGKAIRQVKGYVDQHGHRVNYDRFRQEGRPIGSGTVESGVKNVVQWRMKHGGQHWSPEGAMPMLAAVGEVRSKRWSATRRRFPKAAWAKSPRWLECTRPRNAIERSLCSPEVSGILTEHIESKDCLAALIQGEAIAEVAKSPAALSW